MYSQSRTPQTAFARPSHGPGSRREDRGVGLVEALSSDQTEVIEDPIRIYNMEDASAIIRSETLSSPIQTSLILLYDHLY